MKIGMKPPSGGEPHPEGPMAALPAKADIAIREATSRWSLSRVGWRGFEALPWVKSLKGQYPEIERIATTCSGPRGEHLAATRKLLADAEPADVPAIQSYFSGKLALEELSCQRNGAGAGACDKRAAYLAIYDVMKEA